MLTISNTNKLMGYGFHSNGINWQVTHVKECIHPASYIITIENENYRGAAYYKFELYREAIAPTGEYTMNIIDGTNKIIDWSLINVNNIKTRDSMLVELQSITNKIYK
jgi:hypothetical protein